jgi:serine phosphatase RsbU (regulator of sigma subunit)
MIAKMIHGRTNRLKSAPAPHIRPMLEANVTIWSSPAAGAKDGGDWCEAVVISDDLIALTVGDVAGHGEKVAGTKETMRSSLLWAIQDIRAPSEILSLANSVALNHNDDVIVTAIVAFLDRRRRTLTFANAGHPPPLMLTRNSQTLLEYPPADIPLGIYPRYRATDYLIAVPPDALLVLYTDGITEHERDPIGGELELIAAARALFEQPAIDSAQAIVEHVMQTLPLLDDSAVMAVRTTAAHR